MGFQNSISLCPSATESPGLYIYISLYALIHPTGWVFLAEAGGVVCSFLSFKINHVPR